MAKSAPYGPCINFPKGMVGLATIVRFVANDAGNGFTVKLASGGVLSLIFTADAQEEYRRRSREDWTPDRREAVLRILAAWANARGKAYRHGLEWHSQQQGVAYSEIKAGCFFNPGRIPPPLRTEYEQGLARRRDTHNREKNAERKRA